MSLTGGRHTGVLDRRSYSHAQASDRDDIVGDGGALAVWADGRTFGGAEQLGLPPTGAQVQGRQDFLGDGEAGVRFVSPGSRWSNRAVADDKQETSGSHSARRCLHNTIVGKPHRRVQVLGRDQVEGA